MITVKAVKSGLTHFPMGGKNYLRRAGLPFVRLILAAVLLGGTISQAVAQTLTLSTSGLEPFSFTLTAPSSIQTFTIDAADLIDGVTVSAPSQFEVSKDTTPADFQNSLSFSTFDFSPTAPTAVLVRMKAQTSPYDVSGVVINVSTTGVTTQTVALTGSSSGWTYAAERDFEIDTTTPGKVTITKYNGTDGAFVVIPATFDGNPVTGIGGGAFMSRDDLNSIFIPQSVTSIGGSAFKDCHNLSSMIIPNSVTSLGSFAFSGCSAVESITLGNSVTDIGESTFEGCSSLNSIIIPNSVNSIGKRAFYDCQILAAITIPSSVTTIGQEAFNRCYGLTRVTIGSNVASLGTSAFMNCTSLASVYFERNTRPIIGLGAFLNVAGVAKGYYYAGYAAAWSGKTITGLALESYANRKEDFTYASEETCTIFTYIGTDPVVWIPPTIEGKSVAVIDEFAFIRKFQVTSVLIPPTVTEIRANAFYHCEALSSIVIPGSVIRVGSSAFSECYNLSRITLEPGVQEIGAFAFNASKPTTVTIPSSVNKIEGSAFCGVGGALTLGLVNFEGRKPPADIDVLAFNGCAVGAVGQYYAGYSAGWSGATINLLPLQSGENPATDFNYTTTGGKVTITGYKGTSTVVMIPPTILGNPVTVITQVLPLATAFSLKSISTLYLPDGLTEIGASTFKNCIGLTRLSLPESLTKIGASAFEGCEGLTSLKLVKNVTDLGGSAFKNCTGLSSVFFERSTPPKVGSGDFTGTAAGARGYYYAGYSGWSTTSSLGGLTMVARSTAEADFFSSNVGGFVTITGYKGAGTFVMIPPTIGGVAVTAIGEGAFWEIGPRVTDVLVPDSVTLIGESAFRSQALLTSIILPSGVTEIKNAAFKGCTALPSINLPNDLITIGDSVFEGCGALTSVIIPNNVTTIGASAFFGTTISASQRGLTSVTLGSSVQTIGDMAFAYNSALGSIRIPASVTTIGAYAFNNSGDDVRSLNVFFDGTTPPATIDAAAFSGATEGTVFTGYYPAGAAGWSGVTITGLKLVSMPSGIFGTSFTVYWASVVGATYTIEVSTTPLFVGVDIVKTVAATASETSKLITGLSVNTNYWYRVTATIAADDTSTTSSSVPVTTGAADLLIPAAPVLSGLPATMVYQQKVVLAGAVSALQRTTSTPTVIPDYNGAGINQTMTIAGLTAGTNYQLNLGIDVSVLDAGFLGGLKIYLQHTLVSGGVTMVDQTRILLDRVGVAAGDTVGSLATGLNVIMSDSGAFNIQSSDTPAHEETPLTGTWQPASLLGGSSFGLSTMGTKSDGSFNWNGDWALVVADLANGGTMRLDSWSMQFSDLSASDTSVEIAGLEYELVPPLSGPAKASISKNELEALSGTGTFQVRARYRAVDGISQVSAWTTQTITLTKKGQTIAFAALGTRSLAPAFMAGASSDSGLQLTYSSSNAGTATIDGASGQVTPVAEGTTTISVAQAGDGNFSPATTVSQVLTIAGTPLNPAWGLSKLYSQDSTNSAVAGVTKGTNTYAYTKIEYAEASAAAQIRIVPISFSGTPVANLTQTNEVALGVIGYSSYSNPASYTSYSAATNAVPDGSYVFVGKNSSSENVTNAVVNWSNNTNDYPVQAPQIVGTWMAQSLRIADPASADTISWVAWTNTPVGGSTNSIRVEVTGSLLSISSPATIKFVTNLPANSTSLAIPAGTLPINQVYSAKVGFVTMTGGAARSTETQFRMVTGPMNPPASPILLGALIGNINVTPGTDVVGTLAAFSDSDAGDTETLSLPALTFPDANDNNLFVLDGRTIKLVAGSFDYATKSSYSILVRATDSYGLYSETAYRVSVQGTQSITFTDLTTKTFGDVPFDLTATASGGAVTYTSSNTGVATISGSTVTIKGAGFTDITASQAGGGAYLAATPVVKRLTVNQAASTISVTGVTSFTYDGNPQGPSTSTKTGSTGAVTYGYVGTGGTTYGPSPTKPTAAGSYTVTAGVASDANFSGATSSPATAFTIGVKTLTIRADDKSRGFGAGNPELTGSVVSGAVDGESFVVTASTTATASSAPGSYSIVPAVTGSTLSNYTVSRTNGTLTVSSAPFAGEDALTAAPAPSSSTKYSFAQLLLNDRTFSGTLSITGVAVIPGVTQGTASIKGSWVVYVPKAGAIAGATDSFNYTLSNGTSTTTGTVTISLVSPDMTIGVSLASAPTLANGYKATFLVMPGLAFEAYGSDTVAGTYLKIGATWTSAASGKLEVIDSAAAVAPSRFYKLKWLP